MTNPIADDPHRERCHTVGELRNALKDYPDDQPLVINHNDVELENVTVHDDDDRVVLY